MPRPSVPRTVFRPFLKPKPARQYVSRTWPVTLDTKLGWNRGSGITLSGGNLTGASPAGDTIIRASAPPLADKFQFEIHFTGVGAGGEPFCYVGFDNGDTDFSASGGLYPGFNNKKGVAIILRSYGFTGYVDGIGTAAFGTNALTTAWLDTNVLTLEVDRTTNTLSLYRDGALMTDTFIGGNSSYTPAHGGLPVLSQWYAWVDPPWIATSVTANFAGPFTHALNSGFVPYDNSAGGYTMPAAPGAYVLTGTDTGLLAGRTLPATPGAYVLTGTDAGTLAGHVLPAAPGAYALTGTDVTLTKTTASVLVATPGSYLITGTATTLLWNRAFPGAPGAYVLTGSDVGMYHGWAVAVASGSYLLTGADVSLPTTHIMPAGSGSYVLTGTAATLTRTFVPKILVASPGHYVLTGNPNVTMTVGLLVDYLFPEVIFRYQEAETVRVPKLNKLAEEARLAGSMAIDCCNGAGSGTGLTDGDLGDVVVSGGGTAMTVESAHPASGYFDVTGSIRASGELFELGRTSGVPADCSVYFDCNNYYGFITWRRFAGGAPITMGSLQVADSGLYWGAAAHVFRDAPATTTIALLSAAHSLIYSPQVTFGSTSSTIGGQNQFVDLNSTGAYAGINFKFWSPAGAYYVQSGGVLGYYGYGLYVDGNPDLHLRCGADVVDAIVIHEIDATHAQATVHGKLAVDDDPYSVSWDGNLNVPTKNAIFDKIEAACTGSGGGGAITAIDGGDATSSGAPYMAIDGGTA